MCAGIAGDGDLERDESSRRRRAEGRLAAKRLIREHGLPMKVVAVDYPDSTNVITVYFRAPRRVDFRALGTSTRCTPTGRSGREAAAPATRRACAAPGRRMSPSTGRPRGKSGRPGHAERLVQPVQRPASIAMTGPVGRVRRYCSYLPARISSARDRRSSSMTLARPSARTHQS